MSTKQRQMPAPVILLACGCYNPVTNMHLRMFEIARDYLHRMGQYEVIGGIISPVHDAYGKSGLVAANHRLRMLKLALKDNWVKVSDFEAKQETWSRTKNVLQYHQNQINAYLNSNANEDELQWIPNELQKTNYSNVVVKLLCGADLLESFGTPNLWANEDIETIVGQHGLVVITRNNTNPQQFIYNSDILSKLMPQITVVTEWISNEISSTKIRTALRRSDSVKYLIPDTVIDYIFKNQLYGARKQTKYLGLLTPSPDIEETSQSNCLYICNFTRPKHPGQAVKIVTSSSEVRKSCDENLIKFIFTEHENCPRANCMFVDPMSVCAPSTLFRLSIITP